MSERFKYALNGVYRIENFAQHLAQNTFPTVQIGTVGGTDGWYIRLEVIENGTIVYPVIHCHNKPQLYIHYYFNIVGKDGQSFFKYLDNVNLYKTYGPRGYRMNILDILNQKNNYLVHGTLLTEYGIHINGVLGVDGIWKFNFNDKLFNLTDGQTIEYGNSENGPPKVFYGHKQLLRLHSPLFQNQVIKFISNRTYEWLIEDCLQIAHGVRIRLDAYAIEIARMACDNKLRNVVQYVDQQFVEKYWNPKFALDAPMCVYYIGIDFGLRHFLAHLVNRFACSKALKSKIQQLDIEKMSGEAMKTFMAKFFKLST